MYISTPQPPAPYFARLHDALRKEEWTRATVAAWAEGYPSTPDDGPITAAERYEGLTLIARDALCAANTPAVMVRLAGNLSVIATAWQAGASPCS